MLRYWDAQTIASEILRRYNAKKALHYTGVADDNLSLLRAATRYFGSWEAAITFAGLDYDEIRLYKVWTRMRIIARIRELWQKGEDLSWRHVSMTLDPQLAGAATKKKHFGSWSRALEAAGLDYDLISRYIRWSDERILEKVREVHNGGRRMNAKKMEAEEIVLLTAARRRFGSWPQALQAAGLQASEIVLRASFKGHQIFQPPITQGKRSPSRPPTVKNEGAASLNPQTQKLPAKNTKKNTLEHDASQHATTQNTTPNNDATQNGATTNRNLQSQRNATAKTAKRNAALKSVVGESAVSESVTVKKVSVAKTLQKTPETSRVKPERQAQNATRASTVAAPKAVKPKVATLKVAESKVGLNTPNVTIVKSLQVQALNSKTPKRKTLKVQTSSTKTPVDSTSVPAKKAKAPTAKAPSKNSARAKAKPFVNEKTKTAPAQVKKTRVAPVTASPTSGVRAALSKNKTPRKAHRKTPRAKST